jgi:hypothetical protein
MFDTVSYIAYLRFYLFIYFFSGNNSYISKQYKDKTSELIKVMAECLHLLKQVTLRNINVYYLFIMTNISR